MLEDLLRLVDDPLAVADLRRSDSPVYPRRRFEFVGDVDPLRVTAGDLVALTLVGVCVPAGVALDLLEGDLGLDVADLLRQVPADVPITSPLAADLLRPLALARDLLEEPAGMDLRTAGTLLARKRPLLVPVPDPVVLCALDWSDDPWGWALDAFSADGGVLGDVVAAARAEAGLVTTGDLRAIETVVWMRHHREHLRTHCPGLRLLA
ncbi:hypothetical protein GCM10027451_32520 [Geodermatophilus aquaeductus]|uniref:Uncharacterized protein n=1 Tax=Geodermatophilus aquaeductus TaxID=1564161 RepID=A0A521F0V4_9ACTN|nr:DUF6308 family protein [Geodermatophilus aquaeductus]SMO89281.1 hypothetical protein SAMN06273567_106185 [Geodermatophilus aquaeductus]